MPIYSSDSDDDDRRGRPLTRLIARHRPLHTILGGGRVADILLWRDKNLSAGILLGFTFIWFLFQVVEYNFITLCCQVAILLMLVLFVWSNGAGFIKRSPPRIEDVELSEFAFRRAFAKINWVLSRFYRIARGQDFGQFLMVISSLWILSVIGNYFSTLNLLYFGFVCVETLPALYERYESEVNYLASKGNRDAKKLFKKLDSKVLNKIPRGPVKEKKHIK